MIECNEKTDEELVQLVFEQPDYFLCIMKRYEKRLLVYIRRIATCCVADAEDILQEVYIKTYSNLAEFSAPLRFSAWIYRIAHNQTVSYIRHHSRRPQEVNWENDDATQLIERMASDTDLPKEMDVKILQEQVNIALSTLNPKYREVLVLRYLEEKDYQEISDILRIPMGTVATLLNRAKKEMRKNIYE